MSTTELHDRVLYAEYRRDVAEDRVRRYELTLDAKDAEITRLRKALLEFHGDRDAIGEAWDPDSCLGCAILTDKPEPQPAPGYYHGESAKLYNDGRPEPTDWPERDGRGDEEC